jgi:hypothetical protein
MKKFKLNTYNTSIPIIITSLIFIALTSCNNNTTGVKEAAGPPKLDSVSVVHKDSTTTVGWRMEPVYIMGKNLESTQSIMFNGFPAVVNLALATDHGIIVTIPGDAPWRNSKWLVVTNSAGSDKLPFHIHQPSPEIVGFSPDAGTGKTRTRITITGHVLDNADTVMIGNELVPITFNDSSHIGVVASPHTHGLITVVTPGGSDTTNVVFGNKPPAITGFLPTAGFAGQTVTIKGHHFGGLSNVSIGNVRATIISSDTNEVKIKIPGDNLFGKISMTNDGGTATSDIPFGFKKPIYIDAMFTSNGPWTAAGYGSDQDYQNTAPPVLGTHSIKIKLSSSYGAMQIYSIGVKGATPVDLSNYTTLEFSVYVPKDSKVKKLKVSISKDFDDGFLPTTESGKWKVVTIPLSEIGNPSEMKELDMQGTGNPGLFYIDNIGFY